ncbi:MAG TPA: SpoIIE family protein phosphatase [Gallionella sp.]|nr:SpoIIE family protein phosphatase [Gallionella sp.]
MHIDPSLSGTEHPIPEGAVLVSKTDLKGVITYCNRTFSDISGYSDRELVGSAHNLVRHPDVPPEIFADLWKTIRAGNPWNGVVKNRCKNGDYYWVEANVTPLLDEGRTVGYVSLRYRASAEQIAAAELAYRSVRAGRPAQSNRPDLGYVVQLQQRLADKIVELEKYRDHNEEDQRLGSFIMAQMLRMDDDLGGRVRRYAMRAEHLSGDVLIAAQTPANAVHVMLADAVGHGLAAAINVLPVCRAFYDLTEKGFSIEQIASDLNELVNQIMPVDRFVSTALLAINYDSRVIEVWNGGVPALRLLDRSGGLLHSWPSRHLPLGILDAGAFSAKPEILRYEEDCQLYLFSDGLVEACCPRGMLYSDERIAESLASAPHERRFEALIADFKSHLAGCGVHDDVVVAMMDIVAGASQVSESPGSDSRRPASRGTTAAGADWRVAIKLGANELKYLDTVPLVVQLLSKMNSVKEHHSALFLILSELFNNALDHGVLGLDSGIKRGLEGFERYLELRDERMRALERGEISIEIDSVVIEGRQAVKIHILDSGDGFDYRAMQAAGGGSQHGRGIVLTRSLVSRLEYFGKGNEVVAYYICA